MAETSAFAKIWLKTITTLWLVAIAYVDARTAIIPNQLTLPAIALLGRWRAIHGGWYALTVTAARLGLLSHTQIHLGLVDGQALSRLLFVLLAWGLCFLLWQLHVVGGGDAKTLMALFALFPTADFGAFLCAGVLILSLPLLALKLWRTGPCTCWQVLREKLTEGPLLPTERELEAKGQPYAWTFCLPGVAYLWFLW